MRWYCRFVLLLVLIAYIAIPRPVVAHGIPGARAVLLEFLQGELEGEAGLRLEVGMFTEGSNNPIDHVVDLDASELIIVMGFDVLAIQLTGDNMISATVRFTKIAEANGFGVGRRRIDPKREDYDQLYRLSFADGNWKVCDPPVPAVHPVEVERFLTDAMNRMQDLAKRISLSTSQQGYLDHLKRNLSELRVAVDLARK